LPAFGAVAGLCYLAPVRTASGLKLLLFDLDGTILRARHVAPPFEAAVRDVFGVAVESHGVRFDGKTDPVILAELLEQAGVAVTLDSGTLGAFEDCLAMRFAEALDRGTSRVEAIDGVPAVLDALARDPRFALAVLTGNLERSARIKLGAADLARFFAVGAYGSDAAARAALPPIARERFQAHAGIDVPLADCVIVGDTPLDHAAAEQNGMPCVLVASGRTSLAELTRLRPRAVFADWSDARAIHEALARL